jgi:hypothetical protein
MKDKEDNFLNCFDSGELQSEFIELNKNLNRNLKTVCPVIENLIKKLKNEPQQFETQKVTNE